MSLQTFQTGLSETQQMGGDLDHKNLIYQCFQWLNKD